MPELSVIAESGDDIPNALRLQPELFPGLQPVWAAYCELTTTRCPSLTGQFGPIPWTAIERYARHYEIFSGEEFEDFVHLIRAADQSYLRKLAELGREQSNAAG